MLIDPKTLLTYRRWDIVAKYVYIKYFDLYLKMYSDKLNLELNVTNDLELGFNYMEIKELEFFRNIYYEHILLLNGGVEIKTNHQDTTKNGIYEFLNDFHKLYFSIKDKGFDENNKIPIGYTYSVLNGGHRIAISSVLNIRIPVNMTNKLVTLDFMPQAFDNRAEYEIYMPFISDENKINVINKIKPEYQDFLLKEYVLAKTINLSILVIYNSQNYINNKENINKYLIEKDYKIVYHKIIKLNNLGALNFIRLLFSDEHKVKKIQKFSNVYQSDIYCEFSTSILLLERHKKDLKLYDKDLSFKKDINNYLKSDDGMHFICNPVDTVKISNVVYHHPSINFLNKLPFMIPVSVSDKFNLFLSEIRNQNSNHFLIINQMCKDFYMYTDLKDENKNLASVEDIKQKIKNKKGVIHKFEYIYNPLKIISDNVNQSHHHHHNKFINSLQPYLESQSFLGTDNKKLFDLLYLPDNYIFYNKIKIIKQEYEYLD
jgi:hypothetical protein